MQVEFTEAAEDRKGNFMTTYCCGGKYSTHTHKELRFARFSFLTHVHSISYLMLMESKDVGETCIFDLDTMEVIDSFVVTRAFRGELGRKV